MSIKKIYRNAAQCLLCDEVVESKHVHDFVRCKCGNIFVDGGLDYIRRGVRDSAGYKDLSDVEEEDDWKNGKWDRVPEEIWDYMEKLNGKADND